MWNVLSHYEVASSLRTNRRGLYLPAPLTQAAHNHICEDSFLLRCCVLNVGPWICKAHSTAELCSQTKCNNFTTNPGYIDITLHWIVTGQEACTNCWRSQHKGLWFGGLPRPEWLRESYQQTQVDVSFGPSEDDSHSYLLSGGCYED